MTFRHPLCCLPALALLCATLAATQDEQDPRSVYPRMPAGSSPPLDVEGAQASNVEEMRPYSERIAGTGATFEMIPIQPGTFLMGSPPDEQDRGAGEGPQHQVSVGALWIGRCEVSWQEYHPFQMRLDQGEQDRPAPQDAWADAVSRPTPPYVPMDFEMGVDGYPAICMTQFAARQYTKWLSMKTGRFYRLPTEAEWEFACRAGTTTAYSFGDDLDDLDEHAWHFDNADDKYQKVGTKKPNPWGLYDMHGNVAEWVIDGFEPGFYGSDAACGEDPILWPTALYPRVVRGGSWDSDPEDLRSAARIKSSKSWKVQDPQLPKSIWYHTDATFVGFRVVRPLVEPGPEEKARFWEADVESVREIQTKQRRGGR